MTIIKKLTPEQRKTKDAMSLRVLDLYRIKSALDIEKLELDERIKHLESQIDKIGGPGTDVEEILRNTNLNKED